jgi:hypothetical protein
MDRKTEKPGAQAPAAETWPAAAIPDAMFGHAEATRSMLWAVENTRLMLELNRTLLDLSRDMLRRQQDAVIAATLGALGGSAAPDRAPADPGFADLARLSFEAFDRMAEAMRAANDAALRATAGEAQPGRRTAPR